MDRSSLVYAIVFVASFGMFCSTLLKNEYIFMRVAESYNTTKKASTCSNQSESSDIDILVTSEVSRWTLLLDLTLLLPASIASIFIATWGDKVGRKIVMAIPVFGMILGGTILFLIVYFKWSLYVFYLCNFVSGISGFYMAMLTQGVAFLGDITEQENRGKKFVILETSVGIGGGIAGVLGGFWLKASGYLQPILFTLVLEILALVGIYFLPDSKLVKKRGTTSSVDAKEDTSHRTTLYDRTLQTKVSDNEDHNVEIKDRVSDKNATIFSLLRSAWKLYSNDFSRCKQCNRDTDSTSESSSSSHSNETEDSCSHKGRGFRGRTWRMWAYLIVDSVFMLVFVGTSEAQSVYFLSEPLCFSPPLLGGQLGFKFSMFAVSPLVVYFCQRVFSLANNTMIILGVVGLFSSCLIISFAVSPLLVFIGTLPMLLVNLGRPFIMTQISGMVLDSQLGSAFALITSVETAMYLLGTVTFLNIYPATKHFYNGFMWVFGAILQLVPFLLMTFVIAKDRSRDTETDEERKPLIT